MNAAYVLDALHDPELREVARAGLRDGRDLVESLVRQAIADGQIPSDRNPSIETDLILSLTGLTPLLELGVIEPRAALAAARGCGYLTSCRSRVALNSRAWQRVRHPAAPAALSSSRWQATG